MKKYFVILSTGSYSDYSPYYYMGEIEITQEELDKKGREIGDKVIAEFEALPERPRILTSYDYKPKPTEKYDLNTNKTRYNPNDNYEWEKQMEKWLFEKGYEKLPEEIPEINIEYSDLPHNSFNPKN